MRVGLVCGQALSVIQDERKFHRNRRTRVLSSPHVSKCVVTSRYRSRAMEESGQYERAGIRLKRARERLGLTLREVEAHSQRLADQKHNQDFFISRGWLNNIENGTYTP